MWIRPKAATQITHTSVAIGCTVAVILGMVAFLDSRLFPFGREEGTAPIPKPVANEIGIHSSDFRDVEASRKQRVVSGAQKLHSQPLKHLSVSGDGTIAQKSATVKAHLADAEARLQVRQYQQAVHELEKAAEQAEIWIVELQDDDSNFDEARQIRADAHTALASFYLARGNVRATHRVLARAAETAQRVGGITSPRERLLLANALRDERKLVAAIDVYSALLEEDDLSSEITALARGELARTELLRDRPDEALSVITREELLEEAEGSPVGKETSSVIARLEAWLGEVELALGDPEDALAALNRALLQVDKAAPGAKYATPEVQEALHTRARTQIALGDMLSARKDLDTVCRIQRELWAAIQDELWTVFAEAGHPDARLRGLMARSELLRAELRFAESGPSAAARQEAAEEALRFAEKAQSILQETAEAGALPTGPGVATLEEAQAMAELAQRRATEAEMSQFGVTDLFDVHEEGGAQSDGRRKGLRGANDGRK